MPSKKENVTTASRTPRGISISFQSLPWRSKSFTFRLVVSNFFAVSRKISSDVFRRDIEAL
jgi:hypothetical protein